MSKTLLPFLALLAAGQTAWQMEDVHTLASLRGLSIRASEIWASGTRGTYLHSSDGGVTWHSGQVDGAASLDFRAVAVVGTRVYLVSSGPGDQSRIYESEDAGRAWTLQFTNTQPKGFFDAAAFWDTENGIVLGDPINGHWDILTTHDSGKHWLRHEGPAAQTDEGAFAASGTCLIARGSDEAWFVTGGKGGGRVFYSKDQGRTWMATKTSVRHDGPGAGIFSIAYRDDFNGIVVGGDYSKPAENEGNVAITSDGGRTWRKTSGIPPHGYRSAVTYWPARKAWIAVGISGSDISFDDGENWHLFDSRDLNATAVAGVAAQSVVVAVGPKGVVATIAERYTQR